MPEKTCVTCYFTEMCKIEELTSPLIYQRNIFGYNGGKENNFREELLRLVARYCDYYKPKKEIKNGR